MASCVIVMWRLTLPVPCAIHVLVLHAHNMRRSGGRPAVAWLAGCLRTCAACSSDAHESHLPTLHALDMTTLMKDAP